MKISSHVKLWRNSSGMDVTLHKYQMNGRRQLLYHKIKIKVLKMNVIIIDG